MTFGIFLLETYFFFFFFFFFLLLFTNFKLLMFHNNIVNISEIINKGNLLKTCLKSSYHTNFCIFCSHFSYRKKYSFFFKPVNRMKLFKYTATTNGFTLKYNKSFQNLHVLCKGSLCKVSGKKTFGKMLKG